MRPGPLLRSDRDAFSAFYGAFAVVLAATVVFGALAASSPAERGPDRGRPDETLASAFLATLLASTEPATNLTLGQALTRACLAEPCGGVPTPVQLVAWAGARSQDIARPLGVSFLLILSVGGLPDLHAGPLEARPGLALARAEVFHPGLDAFAAVVLFLGP